MIREARHLRIGDRITTKRGIATVTANVATTDAHGVPCLRVIKIEDDGYLIPHTLILDAGAPVKLATASALLSA